MLRVLPFVALLTGSMAAAIKSSADKAAKYTRDEMFDFEPDQLDALMNPKSFEEMMANLPKLMKDDKVIKQVAQMTHLSEEDIRNQMQEGLKAMDNPDVKKQMKKLMPKLKEQLKQVTASVMQMNDEERTEMMEKIEQKLATAIEKQDPKEMQQILLDLSSKFAIKDKADLENEEDV